MSHKCITVMDIYVIKMMETPEASVSDFCFAMMDVLFASI